MRILVLLDPLSTLAPKSDTTVAIIDEALARGHHIWVSEPHELWLRQGQPGAIVEEVVAAQRQDAAAPALRTKPPKSSLPLESFQAVLMRKDPPYDTAYHLATLILEHARGKTLLVNDPRGLREANEKLYIFHFPELVAQTLVTDRIDELRSFLLAQGGEMVVKPLDGHGGSSVFHVRAEDHNTGSILELMTQNEKRWVMAQRYLDVTRHGDKRILLLDGEPIGALLRMPKGGELRSNLHVGGQAVRTEITDRDRQICARLKPRLQQDGLFFVGIDVIDGHLTEVNVTSPTGVQSIDELLHIRLEAKIVDFLEQRAPHGNSP
jgi:glutathione synthase